MNTNSKFDREQTIQKATALFWEKGYHATSMRNLQDAIDLRPGSIYASFGSKEGLFKETLQYYTDFSLDILQNYAAKHDSPMEALKAFVNYAVIESKDSAPCNICMLVKTISELTEDNNAELLSETKRLLAVIEKEFIKLLTQAQKNGELNETKDPKRLARLLQMQIMGLRSYARANSSNKQLKELIDESFASLH